MSDSHSNRSVKIGDRPINLTQALKLAACVQSGGEAKSLIDGGLVRVNGVVETRKRRKLCVGDRIEIEGGPLFEVAS